MTQALTTAERLDTGATSAVTTTCDGWGREEWGRPGLWLTVRTAGPTFLDFCSRSCLIGHFAPMQSTGETMA